MSSTDTKEQPVALDVKSLRPSFFRRLLRPFRWMVHPVTVFVGLQVLWVMVVVLWVVWFFERQDQLLEFARMLGNPNQVGQKGFWSLVIGIILLVLILIGVVFLFVVAIRQVALNRQQRSFVSSVTHELRSPLASLRLLLETLRIRKIDPDTQDQMFSMMQVDTERLVRLVDRILVSSRLDRGILTLGAPETFSITSMIDDVLAQLRYADGAIAERIRVQVDKDVMVRTIRPALALILSNLVENAIKYSPKGSSINIAAQVTAEGMVLSVIDQGRGLSRSDRRRIFRMFYRSGDAISQAIPGTGLGLYIVKETATVLGGKVAAESKGLGKGSTFTLILPSLETSA